ncbi:MAG: NAD-dependent epimerase/dehydratase family protein [Akkermansiaceae bacterium]|nr:NAD-dependent epimerase/dehydratase family protein [Akkermansiaceae bacterium]
MTLDNQTVIVTGGLGLIGSFVCDELLARGARVIVVDDESKGGWTYCGHLRDRVLHRKGSLEDSGFARSALAGADIVMHLASKTCGVGFSSQHHLELLSQNNLVTANVLSALMASPPAHLLITSSSCVYSDDSPTPMDDRADWYGEPELVNRGYGWAKRVLEQMSAVYASELGIGLTIVRPVNVYGERYHWLGSGSQAIPMLVKRIMDGVNPLVIWGSGQQRRSYVHAADCARMMVQLVENKWAAGKSIEFAFDTTKPEGRFVKAADSSRLRLALGGAFQTGLPLAEGMRRMVDWYHQTFPR